MVKKLEYKIHKNKFGLGIFLTSITTLISFLSIIVYITWYVASIEKRVAILERNDVQTDARIFALMDLMNKENDQQDHEQDQLSNDTTLKLIHLDEKIEKIYSILLEIKKKN